MWYHLSLLQMVSSVSLTNGPLCHEDPAKDQSDRSPKWISRLQNSELNKHLPFINPAIHLMESPPILSED
jgi:hypothetical protein